MKFLDEHANYHCLMFVLECMSLRELFSEQC